MFEKFIKVSMSEFDNNSLYFISFLGYTWQCGLNYTDTRLQTLQDKGMLLLLENNFRGGISSVMGDRYVKSDQNLKILYIDASNLYGHSTIQPLPYDEIKLDRNIKLEDILNTPDDIDIFVEVDLKYPDKIEEKTKNFPFCPQKNLVLIVIRHIWVKTN